MAFTEKGYEARGFRNISEEVRSDLETNLGTPINAESDSVIGIINSIFANQIAIQENNVQALSNNLDIYKAEGVYLDQLARYIGLTRLDARPATGLIKVTRNSTTDITSSILFKNSSGLEFTSPQIVTKPSACVSIRLAPFTVTEGIIFSLTVNGAIITKTALAADTATSIVNYFRDEIISILGLTVTNELDVLQIVTPDTDINSLNVSSFTNFSVDSVTAYNQCESVERRFIQVSLNTITQLVSSNASITAVINPLEFVNGRDLETDEELRGRYELSFSLSGSTTFDNVLARILQLPNVTDAFLIENSTMITDPVTLQPAKSYTCVVVDGDPTNIAQTIWETKPLGVQTVGDIDSIVTDIKGNTHTVSWSRPVQVYIFVEVSYTIYDEESFPINGESLIRDAVLRYGRTLTLGEDVIPNRFIGDIYAEVSGLDSLTIRVGKTLDINDLTPVGGYQTSRIAVGLKESPIFTAAKVGVVAL